MTAQKAITDNELIITRSFDAPPSVVFALWSSPEHMKRWMGPKNFTCPEAAKLVRQVIRGERTDVFRVRQSSLDAYLPILDALWTAGCRNGAELWRQLKTKGFRGSLRIVGEWATRRRRAERASDRQLQKVPSARTIARLMTTARDHLSKADAVTIAAIESGTPMLMRACRLVDRFQTMIRCKIAAGFDQWIIDAGASLIASFANGIAKDQCAVRAAITQPWSNGQTEGQITKLKLVKRQMYGRGKLDLLQARLLSPT